MKLNKIRDYNVAWERFIVNNDQDALATIYFKLYDLLFTYGLKHTSNRQLVEDAIQTVFLNILNNRKQVGKVNNLKGYLFTAFRHQLFLDFKKQKNIIITAQIQEENFSYFKNQKARDSDDDQIEEIHKAIRKSIEKLPPKQQEILFLRFNNGISYEEIAQICNISVDSCYKSVYRSVKTVRKGVEKIINKGFPIILLLLKVSAGNSQK